MMSKYIYMIFLFIVSPLSAETKEDRKTAIKQILKIEDLIPNSNKWTITTGLGVSQSSSRTFDTHVVEHKVSPHVSIPFIYNENNLSILSSVDGFISLQYGLTNKVSPYISMGRGYQELNYAKNSFRKKSKSTELDSYSIGLSYQIDSVQPFNILIVGFSRKEHADAYSTTLTSNWIYDPIVMGLSTTYQRNVYDKTALDYFAIKGSLAFAVNPKITINGSFNNRFSVQADDPIIKGADLGIGTGMSFGETVTMSTGVNFSLTDEKSYNYKLNFSFKV